MTRRQQYSSTKAEIDRRFRQRIDRSDPIVARFVADYGLTVAPVAITLIGESCDDVNLQIARLHAMYGPLITFARARLDHYTGCWNANGTLLA